MVKRALLFLVLATVGVVGARAEVRTVPAGSMIYCRLNETLSTGLNFQGDTFTATVSEPLVLSGDLVIPSGARIEGRIVYLSRPGRIRGVGGMRLSAEKVVFPDGRASTLSAVLINVLGTESVKVADEEGILKGPNSRKADLQEVGATAAAGGVIGAIFGGVHGTFVGATVGGVAGFVDRLRRRGKDLTIPSGTQLQYQLTRELVIYRQAPRETASRIDTEVIR